MEHYILFVLPEENNNSAIILVPTELFLKSRNREYLILKRDGIRKTVWKNKEEFAIIDNLLIQHVGFKDNVKVGTNCPFTDFYRDLMGCLKGYYYEENDKEWYTKSQVLLCKNSDHIDNYVKCKN